MTEFNDFGFTAVDEDELQVVQNAATSTEDYKNRLDEMYNSILPLLNNLKLNPEKEYILWPNRLEKIEQFEKKLLDIWKGSE